MSMPYSLLSYMASLVLESAARCVKIIKEGGGYLA